MADRDITVDVTIRSDTRDAKKAADALGDIDKAAGGAGKSMKGMEGDSASLTTQIGKSKETIKSLEAELTKVGNNPGLRKSLRVERSWLAELEKISKSLVPDLGGGGSITLPSPKLDLGGLKSSLMPALIGLGVVASPAIGAMIAGAVVGGVGLGGIVGGVVAATKDNRVKAAWSDFAGSISADDFGKKAFAQPVIDSIGLIKRGFEELNLGEILGKGADAVPKLAKGLVDFAKGVMPGVSAALDRADEYADVFAVGLGGIGKAVGDMIKDFAESDGALEGLRLAFQLTVDIINLTSTVVSNLADTYVGLTKASAASASVMDDLMGWNPIYNALLGDSSAKIQQVAANMDGMTEGGQRADGALHSLGSATELMNAGLDPFAAYLKAARREIDQLNDSLEQIFAGELSVDEATLRWKQSILELTESVKENGHSLADNTEEGLNNQQMLHDMVKDAMGMREAVLQQTGSVDEANAAYKRQVDALKTLAQNLGFSKEALDKIIGTYEINVVTRYTEITGYVKKNKAMEDRYEPRAAGGPVAAGVPYTINERGYETVTFPAGGTVHPANLTPAMSGGGGGVTVMFDRGAGFSGDLDDALWEWFLRRVRVQGDGNVQVAASAGAN